ARVVLPDQPGPLARLLADEAAPRALPFPDHEAGRAAELLGDPVRDERQVVQVEAEVVRTGAGLGAPVLDDLEVVGLAGGPRLPKRGSGALEDLLGDLADLVQRPVLARRRDDRPPAARSTSRGHRDLGEAPI